MKALRVLKGDQHMLINVVGFTNINVNNEEGPRCVICYEILLNELLSRMNIFIFVKGAKKVWETLVYKDVLNVLFSLLVKYTI